MSTERQEQVRVERADGFERRQKVVNYAPSTRVVLVSRLTKLIWLLVSVVDLLIAFRFVLKAIAANPASGFASVIYGITDFMVAPFMGLVNSPTAQNGSMFDVASLFAIAFYSIAVLVIVQLLRILFASTGGSRQVTTIERHE